ncbi:hypothetical protein N2W54_005099 [Lotmaria passim]
MMYMVHGRCFAALVTVAAVLVALVAHADDNDIFGIFNAKEGETAQYELIHDPIHKCPGGVLWYSVKNAFGNVASFPNAHKNVLQFKAATTGMTSGSRQTSVTFSVLCNHVTSVYEDAIVYFMVTPSESTTSSITPTTSSTPVAPSTVCKATMPITVPNNVVYVVPSSAFTSSCSTPTLTLQSQTSPSGATTSLFETSLEGGSSLLSFNSDCVDVASGTYTATISVKCDNLAACVVTQQIVIEAAPTSWVTTMSPQMNCPGDYAYSLMLNADGSFTAQTSSLVGRAAASGEFCTSGGNITSTVGTPSNGSVSSNPSDGTFSYMPNSAVAGDAMDSFDFVLRCPSEGTSCHGTAVISIVGQDSGEVYYAMGGAITCRGTCNAGAWRASPSNLNAFDVSTSGVAVTPRKDSRAVDGVDFGFTVNGELLIRAYTTIGNLAARFVTFYPLTAAEASGYLTSSSVPPGSHVSFEPSCLNQQATTGAASSIWTWTDSAALVGHLNTQTNAYKSGDNYYQKFGGNHRQCDVYRSNPCKYAPFLTPTLNDDNNNADNNQTASVQWKLYVNDCDATWVGKASVESLRALRQPDGSPTFRLEGNGAYLVGTVYSQSVKPASWTSPSSGVVHTEHPFDVRLKIHNTLAVDAAALPIEATVVPPASQLSISADVQYTSGKTKDTQERLYAYSLLLYPVFTASNIAANITASNLKVESVSLLNETWTSPSRVECPVCTGTKAICTGTGNKFETNCGSTALMTFEDIDYESSEFDDWRNTSDASDSFASTSVATKNALKVTFVARANGRGSASSTDPYPVGTFAMAVKLSNKQVFHVVVNQTDYISELNTRFLDTRMCRPSGYWPVADPLGSSVPVKPYNATPLAFPNGLPITETPSKEDSKGQETYGAPERLTALAVCAEDPHLKNPHVQLSSMTAKVTEDGQMRNVSMCAVNDERTFGVTDWVMLSLPSVQEELDKVTQENNDNIVADSQRTNDNAYTVAKLQYLVLTVPVAELGSTPLASTGTNGYLHLFLDGEEKPLAERTEEAMWMYPNSGASSSTPASYLPWQVYASSLNYRRVGLRMNSANNTISEPFNFAFIPGSLLDSSSSIRVQMTVRASIAFLTYVHTSANATHASQVVKTAERQESLLYVVSLSRSISSAVRFDSDAYNPVTTMTSGISKKSATAILIVLIVAIIGVLAASVYIEFTYKRIIHNAKYHPKRPDSAVGIRYGRDGKPKENQKTAKEGSRAETSLPASATKTRAGTGDAGAATEPAVKTKFGTVRGEQRRVPDSARGSSSASSEAGAAHKEGDTYKVVNPPIGEEQTRVVDDEVAQF